MSRTEKDFLIGFARAARLTKDVLCSPPRYTSPREYIRDVAHLHEDSDDLMSRGLAVGCLSALGS